MQDKDFQWFVAHYDEIFAQYGDSYVAIKNEHILGAYPSFAEGVLATAQFEQMGTFIVQHCNGNASGYTGYIASMNFL